MLSSHAQVPKVCTRQHVLIPRQHLFVADSGWLSGLVDNDSVRVHHSVRRHCRVGSRVFEGEAGGKFAVDGAGKMNTASL